MWKDFFSFTKQERLGIFILLALIAGICIGKFLFSKSGTIPEKDDMVTGQAIRHTSSLNVPKISENKERTYVLKPFDPNSADSSTLVSLGIKPYVVKNIVKYRNKGGRFKQPDDFGKLYGLESADFERLKPYIRIKSNVADYSSKQQEMRQVSKEKPTDVSPVSAQMIQKQEKISYGTTIDINIADTTDLKKIPNIGSGFANRIIKYRQIIGGFYSIEQIKEVYGVDNDLFLKISPYITVSENVILQQVLVNQSSLDKLKSHPYINFYQAKVILDIRKKKGKVHDLSELALLEEFSESDLERLRYYLSFE